MYRFTPSHFPLVGASMLWLWILLSHTFPWNLPGSQDRDFPLGFCCSCCCDCHYYQSVYIFVFARVLVVVVCLLICCLVAWLVGWLIGWLVGWLLGCLVLFLWTTLCFLHFAKGGIWWFCTFPTRCQVSRCVKVLVFSKAAKLEGHKQWEFMYIGSFVWICCVWWAEWFLDLLYITGGGNGSSKSQNQLGLGSPKSLHIPQSTSSMLSLWHPIQLLECMLPALQKLKVNVLTIS